MHSKKSHIFFSLSFLFIFFQLITAQESANPFSKGKFEFSLSGGYSATKWDVTYYSGSLKHESTNDNKSFVLGFSGGYYVAEGFSLEPEIQATLFEGSRPAFAGIAGVAYTHHFPNKNFGVFVKGGIGLSNGITYLAIAPYIGRTSDNFDVAIYKLAAGVKVLLTDDIIMRNELEYKISKYDLDANSYRSREEGSYRDFQIKFGFSYLL